MVVPGSAVTPLTTAGHTTGTVALTRGTVIKRERGSAATVCSYATLHQGNNLCTSTSKIYYRYFNLLKIQTFSNTHTKKTYIMVEKMNIFIEQKYMQTVQKCWSKELTCNQHSQDSYNVQVQVHRNQTYCSND